MDIDDLIGYILDADLVIVDNNYYFINFNYNDDILDNLILKEGLFVGGQKKKNKLSLRFDTSSLKNAKVSKNIIEMRDTKGKLRKLELMTLEPFLTL
jgi:hypothetical protein